MVINLYANGGSGNHGCEAIYRSLVGLLPTCECIIHSGNPDEDAKYGLGDIATIKDVRTSIRTSGMSAFMYRVELKLAGNDKPYLKRRFGRMLREAVPNERYISVGGDNYCYSSFEWLAFLNKELNKKKCRTYLVGCSIEPSSLSSQLLRDLKRYKAVVARESMTAQALLDAGLTSVYCLPDPAFALPWEEVDLPDFFQKDNTVAINISPMIIEHECEKGVTLLAYTQLISFVLEHTDMSVALVPHVVWDKNDDRVPSKYLLSLFVDKYPNRIGLIDDANCCVLKGVIRNCRFMIAARTHASIAAYSTCVPTLVVGYSVKAKGIAGDILNGDNDYVIPVQELHKSTNLLSLFQELMRNEDRVRAHLVKMMPEYIARLSSYRNLFV